MSAKQKIISAYLTVWLLFALYGWLFGSSRYRGFFYNLGNSLFWPVKIFPELGNALSAIIILAFVIAVTVFVRDTRE